LRQHASVAGNNRQHPAVELGHFQLFPVFTGFEGPFEDGYAYGLRQDYRHKRWKGLKDANIYDTVPHSPQPSMNL
jgi:hypothetical protein